METKRQEDIRKLMQMPEEAIASLNESEADRLGRLAVMFYKETGDGVYKEKAEQIRAAQGDCRRISMPCLFLWNMKRYVGKKSGTIRSLTGWKMRRQPDLPMQKQEMHI